ncbi:MAG: LptF/LptG family permease [Deltaproteobacteria bacterium]|nr:LptF/LptG family permease [Deltaproteobacteria bacterium]
MTRLDRYVLREVALPFLFSLVAVIVLVFLLQANNLAGAALGLAISLEDIVVILSAALPPFLVLAVPMAYLASVVVGLVRLSGDLEVGAMLAAGASPMRIARAPIALGLAVTLLTLPVAHVLQPLGLVSLRTRLIDVALRNMTQAVEPGTFREDLGGVALYAESIEGETLESVLLYDERDPKAPVLVLANTARLVPRWVEGRSPIIEVELEDGEMHLEQSGEGERYDRVLFARARLALDAERELRERTRFVSDLQQMRSEELLAESERRGPSDLTGRRMERDYWRRFAFPAMSLVFALLGAAIAMGAERSARARAALVSIVTVVAYYLTTRVGDTMVLRGTGTPFIAAMGPNLLFLALGLGALWVRGRAR